MIMAQNLIQTTQPRRRGGMVGYLLGMGPMPAPRPEEIAVGRAIYGLDHPELHELDNNDNDNIDPQLQRQGMQDNGNVLSPHHRIHLDLFALDAHVTVRIPVNNKLARDIRFPSAIPHVDFMDRICAAMDLDPNTAQLGWKSNDEPKRSRAHQLSTQADMNDAFQKLIKMKDNPRRYKEVIMEIIPLVSHKSTSSTKLRS